MNIEQQYKNRLSSIIKNQEEQTCVPFKPRRSFFKSVGIGQKRFWQLVRNEQVPNVSEWIILSAFFNIEINNFFICDLTQIYVNEKQNGKINQINS
jgi:hypothetical protein